jgi:hypothetical protein
MPKTKRYRFSEKGVYSEELESSGESCAVELSRLSEVSAPAPTCSDTVLGLTPSFFIRVMNVVRLIPRRVS